MSRLNDSARTALGYWWNLVSDAARAGFTVTETVQIANQVARQFGETISFRENAGISSLYGYARRIENAGNSFRAAEASKHIDSTMIATAPYAREDAEQASYPLYNVKFRYEYRDQAGNAQTADKTAAFPMALPDTKGELMAQVLDAAEAMAGKYGHTLLSAVPYQILAV